MVRCDVSTFALVSHKPSEGDGRSIAKSNPIYCHGKAAQKHRTRDALVPTKLVLKMEEQIMNVLRRTFPQTTKADIRGMQTVFIQLHETVTPSNLKVHYSSKGVQLNNHKCNEEFVS